jgi:hypothetical protein
MTLLQNQESFPVILRISQYLLRIVRIIKVPHSESRLASEMLLPQTLDTVSDVELVTVMVGLSHDVLNSTPTSYLTVLEQAFSMRCCRYTPPAMHSSMMLPSTAEVRQKKISTK